MVPTEVMSVAKCHQHVGWIPVTGLAGGPKIQFWPDLRSLDLMLPVNNLDLGLPW